MEVQKYMDATQRKVNAVLNREQAYTSTYIGQLLHEVQVAHKRALTKFDEEAEKWHDSWSATQNGLLQENENHESRIAKLAVCARIIAFLVMLVVSAIEEFTPFELNAFWGLLFVVCSIFLWVAKAIIRALLPAPKIDEITQERKRLEEEFEKYKKNRASADSLFDEWERMLAQEQRRVDAETRCRKRMEEEEELRRKKIEEEEKRRLEKQREAEWWIQKVEEDERQKRVDAQYFNQKVTEGIEQMLEASEKPGPLRNMIIQLVAEVKNAMHIGGEKSQASWTVFFACRIKDTNLEYQIMTPNHKEKPKPIGIPYERISSEYKKYSLCEGLITVMKFNPLVGEATEWEAEVHSVPLSDELKQDIVRDSGVTTESIVSFEIRYTGPNVNYEAPGALF